MSLAGLVVAVTPQVVFVGASLNGSSLEVLVDSSFSVTAVNTMGRH